MDNKITKERFLFHIKYDWYKYLIFILIAVFCSIFVFDWIANTRNWERLDIFIVSNKFYDDTLEEDIMKYLNENLEKNMIREVEVTHVSPSNTDYRDLYSVNGGAGSTILVVPYSEIVLTGHQVLPIASNNYANGNGTMFESTDSFVSEFILKDTTLKNHYFDQSGNGKLENLYVFDWQISPESYYDSYYKEISGNVYGFRIDNLTRCPYEWYQYEEESYEFKYEKDEQDQYVLDSNGDKIPVKDKAYLLVNSHASAYTVGKYSVGTKHDNRNETFIVAGFMLERYFYGA